MGAARQPASLLCSLIVVLVFTIAGCRSNQAPQRRANGRVSTLLATGTPLAKDYFYSCILNEYQQGISLTQARKDCMIKLDQATDKGFGAELGAIGKGAEPYFDPANVTASCSVGNPKIAQSSSGWAPGPWGGYSWGGDPNGFYGYDRAKSQSLKEAAIKEAVDAHDRYEAANEALRAAFQAVDEAKASGDDAKVDEAEDAELRALRAALQASEEYLRAIEKAKADPNKKPLATTETGPGPSPCEQALQGAREVLGECTRTSWKGSQCQQLLAKMNGCPDPTLVHVDPDQGYVCGAKIDGEALKKAWVERCQQLKRFGPGGPNPCQPPEVENTGRFATGPIGDICNDPLARIDPESTECYATLDVRPFGEVNIQHLLLWGTNKLGGPIVILTRDPSNGGPRPGLKPEVGPPR